MEQKQRIQELLNKYLDRTAMPAETAELMQWVYETKNEETLQELLDESWDGKNVVWMQRPEKADLIFNLIIQQRKEGTSDNIESLQPVQGGPGQESESPVVFIQRTRWKRYLAAAALLLAMATTFLWFNKKQEPALAGQTPKEQLHLYDVPPGSDKAILTLADGRQVVLDSTTGNIAKEGGITVINLAGQLSYESAAGDQPAMINYHTVSTPRGGQYQLVLSDGSKVWLNAASSLRFPTAFTGNNRVVELTGEGYFEVAHNKAKPFKVSVSGMAVEVLGTHFNINSYEDEDAIRTTLLEGSVKVSATKQINTSTILKPGQQALIYADSRLTIDDKVNANQVVAWKNGLFHFEKASVQQVMRQIARWYDVEIQYQGVPTEELFGGKMQRNLNLSQVLELLQTTGINYKLEGRTLTITP